MDPSIKVLRAVVALARTGHFGQAAIELGVPTSTLSEQVSSLERTLGGQLFLRTSRTVRITALGREVAERARPVVEEHERLSSWLGELRTPSRQQLRIGLLSGLDRDRVTAVLRAASRELPEWLIEVQQIGFTNAAAMLRADRIDVALTGPPDLDIVDIRGREVWHSARVVMVDTAHRLAHRESVGLDDLRGETVIAAGGGRSALGRAWVVDPRPDGVEVRYGPAARDIEEAIQLVAAGMGINFTAATVADAIIHPGVVFVPLVGVGEASTWVLSRAGDRSWGVRVVEDLAVRLGSSPEGGPETEPGT